MANRTGDVLNQARQQVTQWGQQVGQGLGILPNNQQNGFTSGYNTNNGQSNLNGFDYQRQIVQPSQNGAVGPAYNVQQGQGTQGLSASSANGSPTANFNGGSSLVNSNSVSYTGGSGAPLVNSNGDLYGVNSNVIAPLVTSNNDLYNVNSNGVSPLVNGNSVSYSGNSNGNGASSSSVNSNSASSSVGDGNTFFSVRTQRTDQGNRWPDYFIPVESFIPHNINPRNTQQANVDPYGWNDNYKHAYYTRLSQSFFANPNLPSPFPASPYGPQSPQQRPLFPSQIFNPPTVQEQNDRLASQQPQNALPNSASEYFRQLQNQQVGGQQMVGQQMTGQQMTGQQLTPQQQIQLAHSQQTLGMDLSATIPPGQAQLNRDLQFLQNFGR